MDLEEATSSSAIRDIAMEAVDDVVHIVVEGDAELLVNQIAQMEMGEDLRIGTTSVEAEARNGQIGFDEIFPNIYGYLAKKDVLHCRLVCKDWTSVVDSFLEFLPMYYPYRYDNTNEKKIRTVWNITENAKIYHNFPTSASLTNFQNKAAQGHHRNNPFVGRSIIFKPTQSEASIYWDRAKRLGRVHGEHVWFLTISTCDLDMEKPSGPLQVYKNLQEILKLFPNLRYLKISHEDAFTKLENSVEKKMKRFITENPLPELSQLETLILPRGVGDLIRSAFLRSFGKQVGKLETPVQKWNPNWGTFSNLRELSVKYVSSFESLSEEFLKPINAVNLQKLELNLEFSCDENQLFKALQPFVSLKALRLYFNQPYCCEDCKRDDCDLCKTLCHWEPLTLYRKMGKVPLPMILPSVESFVVETASPFMNFRYLKSLPKLKYFRFQCLTQLAGEDEDDDDDDVGAELRKLSRNESTKLWKMMPSLKELRMALGIVFNRPIVIRTNNPWVNGFGEILPQLFCDFRKKDWLKLRRVCKQWKHDTEYFIQNHPIHRPFNLDSYKRIERARRSDLHMDISEYIGFSGPEGFTQFQERFQARGNLPTDNPFFGRSIAFAPYTDGSKRYKGQGALNKFWKSAMEFLGIFGQHVWYLTISYARQDVREDEIFFYRNLHHCLKKLPNLKSIHFMDNLKVKRALEGEDREKLIRFVKENPLPKMKHLEYLQIAASGGLPPITEDYLLEKYGNRIERLEIHMGGWSAKYGNLPKLVQLGIGKITCNLMLPHVLCNLKTPSLLKLELDIQTAVPDHFLFKLLEPLKTLRNLTIIIGTAPQLSGLGGGLGIFGGMPIQSTDYRLNDRSEVKNHHLDLIEKPIVLPNVEHLNIRVCHAQQSFQFLKTFPGLKFLQIRICKNDAFSFIGPVGVEGDDIGKDLRMCKEGGEVARKSKIWEKFPKLRNILILPGTYLSRNGYIYIEKQWNKPPLAFRMI